MSDKQRYAKNITVYNTDCYKIGKWNKTGEVVKESYDIVKFMKEHHNVTLDYHVFDR